jgi:hypothetical protein
MILRCLNLRKATLITSIFLFFTFFSLILTLPTVNAYFNDTFLPSEIQIDQVDRVIGIRYGGLVVINDTIQLSTNKSESTLLKNFPLGVPHKYGSNLCYCFAYNSSDPDETYKTTLDSGLQGKSGYYGINVALPPEGVDVNQNKPFRLTVVSVFSDFLSSAIIERKTIPEGEEAPTLETQTAYVVDFPPYPSLTKETSVCNLTVILPENASYVPELTSILFDEYSNGGTFLNYSKAPLEEFTYSFGSLIFVMETGAEEDFALIEVLELERKLTINDRGHLSVSDLYYISNKAVQALDPLSSVKVTLPKEAYDVVALDQFGDNLEKQSFMSDNITVCHVTLDLALKGNESTKFIVAYHLPWKSLISQQGGDQFNLTFTLFQKMDWITKKMVGKIILPEGAEITSLQFSPEKTYHVQEDIFQEKISLIYYNVTPLETFQISLEYRYSVFWASFRPTLWIGALVAAGCAVALVWRTPKPSVPVLMKTIRPKVLMDFAEDYEERVSVISKLESLKKKAGEGKISRRRYKVQRKMLERRVSTLSTNLSKLTEKIRAAGALYADLMSQLEVAETKLDTVKHDIERARIRYKQGKISREAYRRLLEEYEARKDEAETAVDGVLIRLREESR